MYSRVEGGMEDKSLRETSGKPSSPGIPAHAPAGVPFEDGGGCRC